jgi:hypothetical protein
MIEGKSIEDKVKNACEKIDGLRETLVQNITDYMWGLINNEAVGPNGKPLLTIDELKEIITEMASKETGNIGWFFSQGTTSQGLSGLFGEIAAMIRTRILFGKNAKIVWAGGVE